MASKVHTTQDFRKIGMTAHIDNHKMAEANRAFARFGRG